MDGNGFTTKEVLVALAKRVDDGFADLKQLIQSGHLDHENRIRILEKKQNENQGISDHRRWITPVVVACIGALWWLPSYIH